MLLDQVSSVPLAHKSTIQSTITKTQRAVIRSNGSLSIERVPSQNVGDGEIAVEVMAVGLCRTDLYAIAGEIQTKSGNLIPGHEFSGRVLAVAENVLTVQVGDRVAVNPVVACGKCCDCSNHNRHLCCNISFMGVDFDGACREQITVRENTAHRLPPNFPFEEAVFAEPIAATLGILNSGIRPSEKGLLLGEGRITQLAARVLRARHFNNVSVSSLSSASQFPAEAFDFVIEAQATTEVFREMMRLVRNRGRLILKSRQHVHSRFHCET